MIEPVIFHSFLTYIRFFIASDATDATATDAIYVEAENSGTVITFDSASFHPPDAEVGCRQSPFLFQLASHQEFRLFYPTTFYAKL